jgi:hypothetical protein
LASFEALDARRGEHGVGESMNEKMPSEVQHDPPTIKILEVIEVEVSDEDAADDDVGVAPQRVTRQPRAPQTT